jgi:hypothetical protein
MCKLLSKALTGEGGKMATLVCPCMRGDIWAEFWWVGREYQWVFFDEDNTRSYLING